MSQEKYFDNFAYDWWNPKGHYKLLHKLNPIRIEYIKSKIDLHGKKILDIGCGGGILSEALCKAGAKVTGIDVSGKSIKIAQSHAKEENLKIKYIKESIFDVTKKSYGTFDAIICFEMIEHVDDPNFLIEKINLLSKKNTQVIFSTINRNLKSFILAKLFAEYILNFIPQGTHEYSKFITPSELSLMIEKNSFNLGDIRGIFFNPLDTSFSLSNDTSINYFLYAQR